MTTRSINVVFFFFLPSVCVPSTFPACCPSQKKKFCFCHISGKCVRLFTLLAELSFVPLMGGKNVTRVPSDALKLKCGLQSAIRLSPSIRQDVTQGSCLYEKHNRRIFVNIIEMWCIKRESRPVSLTC